VLALLLAAVSALLWWRGDAFQPVPRGWAASLIAANFHNFGVPPKALHRFHPSGDPADPVRTFYWKQVDALERGVLELFADAHGRAAPLDLIFASTHSARVVQPGPDGERVGSVVPDRSQPSPARAGMLAVLTKLAESHPGRFPQARVATVFLLHCGSVDDAGVARTIDRTVRALTGRPPDRILTTSDKVNPDYRDICAGFATGDPIVIYDSRPGAPNGTTPAARPMLRIGRDGHYHFGTGAGRHLTAAEPLAERR
jgi:hypothetical protein